MDDATRARLREWRRRPPPREYWRPRIAAAVVLLLHLLFVGLAWIEMQPHPIPEPASHRENALQVRLIPVGLSSPVPPPPPAVPASPSQRSPARHEPPARSAMAVHLPAAAAPAARSPALDLYDRTGQAMLPAEAASASPAPDYVAHPPQGDARVMRHADPLPYRATRFEHDFPSPHETLLGQGIRRALSRTHTNDTKQVNLPGGVHLQCKTLLGIPTPFCQDPPAPPSKKDGDERLSMAPAAPLADALRQRNRPSVAHCIAVYRAGKPLPYGCPVDTPSRAVDAELAACVARYRAGKPLGAACPANTPERARRAAAAPTPARSASAGG